jgi:hypothetical protein
MWSLVLTSHKLEAKSFKKWVTSEVLPSIRKTGKYEAEPKDFKPDLDLALFAIDRVFENVPIKAELLAGLKMNAAIAIAPQIASAIDSSRQFLINSTAQEFRLLTPTEIGKELGISGQAVNKLLVAKGFQTKNEARKSRKEPGYLPSGEGTEFSDLTLATGSGKDGTTYQQLRWYSSILDVLTN